MATAVTVAPLRVGQAEGLLKGGEVPGVGKHAQTSVVYACSHVNNSGGWAGIAAFPQEDENI